MDYFDTTSLGNAADMKKGKTTIRKEYLRFYNFCKGGNDQLKSLRRETMFIQMLEGLHPLDAEILCLVKDKELETVVALLMMEDDPQKDSKFIENSSDGRAPYSV